MIIALYFLSFLLLFLAIYNYTVPIGDGNDTIIMYYDEPIDDDDDNDNDGKKHNHKTSDSLSLK